MTNTDIEHWDYKIRKLRMVFKWIVEEKNPNLISFLLREYIAIEKKIRASLNKLIPDIKEYNGYKSDLKRIVKEFQISNETTQQILDIVGKKAYSNNITLGEIPDIIRRINKTKAVSKGDKSILEKLSILITKSAQNRNKIAHGEVTNLFDQSDDGKTWIWQEYILNFFSLSHFLQSGISTLSSTLSKLQN